MAHRLSAEAETLWNEVRNRWLDAGLSLALEASDLGPAVELIEADMVSARMGLNGIELCRKWEDADRPWRA